MDRGTWQPTVHGFTKSWIQLSVTTITHFGIHTNQYSLIHLYINKINIFAFLKNENKSTNANTITHLHFWKYYTRKNISTPVTVSNNTASLITLKNNLLLEIFCYAFLSLLYLKEISSHNHSFRLLHTLVWL